MDFEKEKAYIDNQKRGPLIIIDEPKLIEQNEKQKREELQNFVNKFFKITESKEMNINAKPFAAGPTPSSGKSV